jgi:hypothetical protein
MRDLEMSVRVVIVFLGAATLLRLGSILLLCGVIQVEHRNNIIL